MTQTYVNISYALTKPCGYENYQETGFPAGWGRCIESDVFHCLWGGSNTKEHRILNCLLCVHLCPSSLGVFLLFCISFAGRGGEMAQRLRTLVAFSKNRFNSQHPCGGSQPSITLVLRDLVPSSDLRAPGMHAMYINACRQNTRVCVCSKNQN